MKTYTYQLSMDLIMEEFWELNRTGFRADNGEWVVPYLVSFCADLEETWTAAARLLGGTYCHLKLDLPNSEFVNEEVCQLDPLTGDTYVNG
jgi:hypothetical protein